MSYIIYNDLKVFEDPSSPTGILGDGGQLLQDNFVWLADNSERVGNKNQPSGYPGLDDNGDLVGRIIIRYDTESNLNTMSLSEGELALGSDSDRLHHGDGVTLGGKSIIKTYTDLTDASFMLNHDGAEVIRFVSSRTDLPAKTFNATSGVGLQAGYYNGQRLIIELDATSISDDAENGGPITLDLGGTNYQWNAESSGISINNIVGRRSLATWGPATDLFDVGTVNRRASIHLLWNGTTWEEIGSHVGIGTKQAANSLAVGRWVATGLYSIGVGDQIVASGTNNIVGGYQNNFNGASSIVAGESHNFSTATSSMKYGAVFGLRHKPISSATSTVGFLMHGTQGATRNSAQRTFSSNLSINNTGKFQGEEIHLYGTTTNTSLTSLLILGANNYSLPSMSATTFHYAVSAYNVTDIGVCSFNGVATFWRDGSGNVTVVGNTPTATHYTANTSGCALIITDTTGGAMKIQASGLASKTINWSGTFWGAVACSGAQ